MSTNALSFVSFQHVNGKIIASIEIGSALGNHEDMEKYLKETALVYEKAIRAMSSALQKIKEFPSVNAAPLCNIWILGDEIFKLVEELKKINLQIDNLYFHLERDLKAKRKWLEKVIIIRRYIEKAETIPASLNWGLCEHGTRKAAEKIQAGLPPK